MYNLYMYVVTHFIKDVYFMTHERILMALHSSSRYSDTSDWHSLRISCSQDCSGTWPHPGRHIRFRSLHCEARAPGQGKEQLIITETTLITTLANSG